MANKPPETVNKGFARRSYIDGAEGDYRELMSTTPRKAMLDQRLEKKSQFDKPYLKDDYAQMEHEQPPLPGELNIPNPELDWPLVGVPDMPPPELSGPCMMRLEGPFDCCCQEDGEYNGMLPDGKLTWPCLATAGFMVIPMALHPPKGGRGFNVEEIWCNAVRAFHNGKAAKTEYVMGGPTPLKIYPNESADGRNMWRNGDTLQVYVYHQKGHVICQRRIKINCFNEEICLDECDCEDPPEGPFLLDENNTAETIVAGETAIIAVLGGCPPFTFSTSSLGYSFSGESSLVTNNRSVVVSCASGSCDVDYDVYANVSVIDFCGEVITVEIRNTSGRWIRLGDVIPEEMPLNRRVTFAGSSGGVLTVGSIVGIWNVTQTIYIAHPQFLCSGSNFLCDVDPTYADVFDMTTINPDRLCMWWYWVSGMPESVCLQYCSKFCVDHNFIVPNIGNVCRNWPVGTHEVRKWVC